MNIKFRLPGDFIPKIATVLALANKLCSEIQLFNVLPNHMVVLKPHDDSLSPRAYFHSERILNDEATLAEALLAIVLSKANALEMIPDLVAVSEERTREINPLKFCAPTPNPGPCPNEGSSVNSSCHCAPDEGGESSCQKASIGSNLEALMKNVSTEYHGDLILHQGIWSGWGGPATLQLPILKTGGVETSYTYEVVESLLKGLPLTGINSSYQSCAIIGNSGNLLNKKRGEEIDHHEMVYRYEKVWNMGLFFLLLLLTTN